MDLLTDGQPSRWLIKEQLALNARIEMGEGDFIFNFGRRGILSY